MMFAGGVISLLEEMISNPNSYGSATVTYLNLSFLEEAKPVIDSSPAVPFLTQILRANTEPQCKLDALHALYNISTLPSNILNLISAGIVSGLQSPLTASGDHTWAEKVIAVLINLASCQSGKDEIISAPGVFGGLATMLDIGEPIEQEQAVSCLLILCEGNEKCSQIVLQDRLIPTLVSMSANGTYRGKEKAQKLLMLFREQRQRDQTPPAEMHRLAEVG